jgi:hypothetical protein
LTLNIPTTAMDRNLELERNRIRIVVSPYLESVPSDALVLSILPPGDGSSPPVPFGPGFVMHNTHSLPTNTEHIATDLGQLFGALATIPVPLRALTPSIRYVGDQNSGTFSVARYNSLQSIASDHVDAKLPILGFPASPRYVEPQIGPGDATNWPFFYEDKRNQFYVSIQTSFVPYHLWDGFGVTVATAPPVSRIPYIPPLTTKQIPVPGEPNLGLINPAVNQGPGATWTYAGGERNVVAAFSNQASFSFQGRVIGLAGGAPAPSTLRGVTTKNKGG